MDYRKVKPDEMLANGKPNKTGKSRVSLDFRVVLKSDYDKDYIKISSLHFNSIPSLSAKKGTDKYVLLGTSTYEASLNLKHNSIP